jgi:hypothetical protein
MFKFRSVVFTLVLFIGCQSAIVAHEMFITIDGDTTLCQIIQVEEPYLIFTLPQDAEHERKIALNQLQFYGEKDLELDKSVAAWNPIPLQIPLPKKNKNKNKGLVLGVGIGYMYLFDNMSEFPIQLRSYAQKLKSGYTIKADATYFFGNYFGMGAKYAVSKSDSKADNVSVTFANGQSLNGTMEDHITIHAVGLYLTTRFGNNGVHFMPGVSAGYTFFKNKGQLSRPMTLQGNAFSMAAHASVDLKLTGNLHAVVGVDLVYAKMSTMEFNDSYTTQTLEFTGKDRQNLSRFEFWAGLRYYFNSHPPLETYYYD